MTDPVPESRDKLDVAAEPAENMESPRKNYRLGWVFVMAMMAVAGWGCYVWATELDGFNVRRFFFLREPEFRCFPVRGEAYFNDKPLESGHLEAHLISPDPRLERAIANINPDGTFEFFSNVRGALVSGVPSGEYRLLLQVFYPVTGFGYPDQILPAKYYDLSTTPLKMTVTSDPVGLTLTIRENGELQPRPTSSASPRAGRPEPMEN